MLLTEGEARYADLLEQTLYNAVLPGISLDGQRYFYQNPLADEGSHRRQEWFGTACCPPNVARTLASLPGYLYSVTDDGIWVHLYAAGTVRIALPDGRQVTLRQQTRYPWDGKIEVEVDGEGEFALNPRIPGWCEEGATLAVNGEATSQDLTPGCHAEIRRVWRPGDRLSLRLPMPVRQVESHPFVEENAGRVALMRGPLLYCLEEHDQPGVDLREVVIPDEATFTIGEQPDLLGGAITLAGEGNLQPPKAGWADALYRTARPNGEPHAAIPVALIAVPYHLWANREPGRMRVWLRRAP